MYTFLKTRSVLALAGVVMMAASLAWGQGQEAGATEVAGYGGLFSFTGDGGGSHGFLGATVGKNTSDRLHLFGDFSYVPLGSESFSGSYSGISVNSKASAKAMNFGGGLHVSVGPSKNAFAPYVSAVGGGFHSWISASASGGGVSTSTRKSLANGGYFGGGLGVRYFAGKSWGLRPEFQYRHYRYSEGSDNVILLNVGLFKQFRK